MRHKNRQRKAMERERQMVRSVKRRRVPLETQLQKKVTVEWMMKEHRMKRLTTDITNQDEKSSNMNKLRSPWADTLYHEFLKENPC